MREKKVRGIKGKIKRMIERIDINTSEFPTEFEGGYWHFHLPVAQSFIDSSKTPMKVKRFCIQTMLDSAEHLIRIKPNDGEKYRVVVSIDSSSLWGTEIIVFKGESYFNEFFNRNDEWQRWIRLSDERNIQEETGLYVYKSMDTLGFKEEVTDEDGNIYENEIWFIGELD